MTGIHRVVRPGGRVYVGLKGGQQGERMVEEYKYGPRMRREFSFWEQDLFAELAEQTGFDIEDVQESAGGTTGSEPTTWLNFDLTVVK